MLIFLSILMVAVLVWLVFCEVRRDRDTKTKLDELEAVVKRIEQKMVCKEVWDHTPGGNVFDHNFPKK